jgi:hypothetical protein
MPHPNHRFQDMQRAYIATFSPKEDTLEPTHCSVTEISAAKYKVANVDQVADAQTHLMPTQRHKPKLLLRQFPKLFSAKLGLYLHRNIHLDLDPGAKPVRQ